MPTRVILIEFKPEATSDQKETFQQELTTLADKIPYKKNFYCGFNRILETDGTLDAVGSKPERPQFVAILEFASYDDLTRFVGEALHQKFARDIAVPLVQRRWAVNI